MNVAIIIEQIETQRGGAETSTALFARCLHELGCRVSILTRSPVSLPAGLSVVPIKAASRLRAMRTWRFAERAAAHVRAQPYDVVHCITPCLAADVYQPRGGLLPEVLARNVAIRDGQIRRHAKRLMQQLSLKHYVTGRLERALLTRRPGPWVIAISRYVANQLEAHYRFDPGRVRLIFNGVEPDPTPPPQRQAHRQAIRRRFRLADDALMLLCVAHNFKLKGVGQAVRALARVRERLRDRASLIVIGNGRRGPIARLARRLRVADRVVFAGSTDAVGTFYHAADVLVHPTYCDACSRVVLEALAAGLPVVTTRFNGAAERITDGRHGYVVGSPDDVDALADRIERLADDDHRRQCAEQAPQAVASISMRQHAAEVLALYEQIVRSRNTAARDAAGETA